HTLDSVGPMAPTVQQCADTDSIVAGEKPSPLEPIAVKGLRLCVAEGAPLRNLDETVGARWSKALDILAKTGASLTHETLPLLDEMSRVNAKGGLVPAESIRLHRDLFDRRHSEIDPNIAFRFERAKAISDDDYAWMLAERGKLAKAMDTRLAGFDALIMPTAPIVAPTIAEVSAPDVFSRKNALLLSNTSIGNFFDLCSISIPLPRNGGLPVGLMLTARNGNDRRLFTVAAALEKLFEA
ncbi:MAG: amidase, partial [Pseudolabrys sp.]|nr:amidase [Pseudolabrys sp.]